MTEEAWVLTVNLKQLLTTVNLKQLLTLFCNNVLEIEV